MSSQTKIDSARANGAKSRGPKTEEGRKKSSRNAVKHGLYSASVVLSTEPRKQYNEMLDAYLLQFQPEGPVELDLVEEMVAAKWRQRRLRAIETQLLEDEMDYVEKRFRERGEEYNKLTLLSRSYKNQAQSALALLIRHEARLERAYSRALKNLLELQRLRKPASTGDQQKVKERTQPQSTSAPPPPTASCHLPPANHLPPPKKETRNGHVGSVPSGPDSNPGVPFDRD
jgi:hypothetical protein